eukprot:TRINITY_DN12765_c0_g1_i1.p1 TRINITY_DN12765_c0_g1~~TRINITY_DN12765_c0_g1_i1.p1  ORF type:complete len:294 (-),score=55.61 TRINITY_DN12765_c0_g1_i1:70-951(-)
MNQTRSIAAVKRYGFGMSGSHLTGRESLMATVLPWGIFMLNLLLCSNVYHRSPKTVFLIVGMIFVVTLPFLGTSVRKERPVVFCLAAVCLGLEIFGIGAGLLTYDCVLKRYRFFDDAWFYTNVLPSDPAAGYVDAGKIVFADEAKLDFSHTIGFKDKTVYCVTPVTDDAGLAGKVQFWAAGLDCCGPRSGFVCDDAWDPQARAGLVLNDEMHSHFQGDVRSHYMDAIKQAEAAYGISSADDPVLVRWVVNPDKVQENLWSMGLGMLIVSSAVALLVSCATAGFIQSGVYNTLL